MPANEFLDEFNALREVKQPTKPLVDLPQSKSAAQPDNEFLSAFNQLRQRSTPEEQSQYEQPKQQQPVESQGPVGWRDIAKGIQSFKPSEGMKGYEPLARSLGAREKTPEEMPKPYNVEDESIAADVGRQSLRLGTRGLEKYFLWPADAAKFVGKLAGLEPVIDVSSESFHKNVSKPAAEYLFGGGVLDPHTPLEQKADEFTNNFATLMVGASSLPRAALGAGLATATRAGAETLNLGEGTTSALETGVLLTAGLMPRESVLSVVKKNKNAAETYLQTMIDKGEPVKIPGSQAQALEKAFEEGIKNRNIPKNSEIAKQWKEIKARSASGSYYTTGKTRYNYDAKDLWELKKNWNAKFPTMDPFEREISHKITGAFKDTFKSIAKEHPDFYNPWKTYTELYAAEKAQTSAAKWIENNVPSSIVKASEKGFALLGGAGSLTALGHPKIAAIPAALALGGATLRGANGVLKVLTNKPLLKHYTSGMRIVGEAMAQKGASQAVVKKVSQFAKVLERDITGLR